MSISTYKRWMKESYLFEKDPGETEITWTDPKTKEKKKATAAGIIKKGEDHPAYDDAKKMVDKAKDGEKEEPKGKGLSPDDFERDLDDSEPEDKPHGGDTGVDADFGKDDDDIEDDEEARAQAFADMEDEFGDEDEEDMEEEIITINGKKYRPIKESVEPKKHLLREMYERIGGK